MWVSDWLSEIVEQLLDLCFVYMDHLVTFVFHDYNECADWLRIVYDAEFHASLNKSQLLIFTTCLQRNNCIIYYIF